MEHDGNDLSRTLQMVVFGISKQIVKVMLYRLQDQYCHKLSETSICLIQCRVSDCKWFPM